MNPAPNSQARRGVRIRYAGATVRIAIAGHEKGRVLVEAENTGSLGAAAFAVRWAARTGGIAEDFASAVTLSFATGGPHGARGSDVLELAGPGELVVVCTAGEGGSGSDDPQCTVAWVGQLAANTGPQDGRGAAIGRSPPSAVEGI